MGYDTSHVTQAKQAIREVTPGRKRPEVNIGEALSKQMSAMAVRH